MLFRSLAVAAFWQEMDELINLLDTHTLTCKIMEVSALASLGAAVY